MEMAAMLLASADACVTTNINENRYTGTITPYLKQSHWSYEIVAIEHVEIGLEIFQQFNACDVEPVDGFRENVFIIEHFWHIFSEVLYKYFLDLAQFSVEDLA